MNTKIAILTLLAGTNGIPERQPALLLAARIQLGGNLTEADFSLALRDLESKHMIAGVANSLDGITRWTITDSGKLALAGI